MLSYLLFNLGTPIPGERWAELLVTDDHDESTVGLSYRRYHQLNAAIYLL